MSGVGTVSASCGCELPHAMGLSPYKYLISSLCLPSSLYSLYLLCSLGRNLPQDVDLGDLADWYVSCRIGNSEVQNSDTHLRAQRGKASWNWRFKFPVTLDNFTRNQRLSLVLIDWDIGGEMLGANDTAGEAQLSLTPWLKRVYRKVPVLTVCSVRCQGAVWI